MTDRRFASMADVKRANREHGHYFFEPDTLRFFDSRVGRTLYGGRYFVTSEQFHDGRGYSAPRMYTIREALPSGEIKTVGEFQEYETSAEANRVARQLANQTR